MKERNDVRNRIGGLPCRVVRKRYEKGVEKIDKLRILWYGKSSVLATEQKCARFYTASSLKGGFVMAKYECKVCSYIYNEQQAGRPFEELTECPICNEDKSNFVMLEEEEVFFEWGEEEEDTIIDLEARPITEEEEPATEVTEEKAVEEQESADAEEIAPAAEEKEEIAAEESVEEETAEEAAPVAEDTTPVAEENKAPLNDASVLMKDLNTTKDINTDYVVERRQEFWSPFSVKSDKQEEKEQPVRKTWTMENAYASVERVLDLNGNEVKPEEETVLTTESGYLDEDVEEPEKELETTQVFKPLWQESEGTLPRVEEPLAAKAENVFTVESPEAVSEPIAEVVEEVAEQTVVEAVEVPEEIPEGIVTEEAAEEVTEEIVDETVGEILEEEAEAIEENAEKEAVEENAEAEAEEQEEAVVTEEVVEDAEETIEAASEEAVEEAASEEPVEEVAEDVAEEAAEEIAEESEDEAEEETEAVEENAEVVSEETAEATATEEDVEDAEEAETEEVEEEKIETPVFVAPPEAVEKLALNEEFFENIVTELPEDELVITPDGMEPLAVEAVEEEVVEEEVAEVPEEDKFSFGDLDDVEETSEETEEIFIGKEEDADSKWTFNNSMSNTLRGQEENAKRYEFIAKELGQNTVTEEETEETVAEEVTESVAEEVEAVVTEEPAAEEEKEVAEQPVVEAKEEAIYSNGLEEIMILPAQLSPMPLGEKAVIEAATVLGRDAQRPVLLEQPVIRKNFKNVVEYAPQNGLTSEDFQNADAIEIIVGRGEGIEKTISSKEDLRQAVAFLRLESDGCPIGIKLAAGRIERDLEFCVFAKPDFVVLNKFNVVPLPYALYRANKYLNAMQSDLDLVIELSDVADADEAAKIVALGADVIVLSDTDKDLDAINDCLKKIAKETGHYEVKDLNVEDLCTINRDIAQYTDIEHV